MRPLNILSTFEKPVDFFRYLKNQKNLISEIKLTKILKTRGENFKVFKIYF